MVNFYCEWPHRAHVLAPLTAKTGAPNILPKNMHKSGSHNTRGRHDVSMIMEENSSDQSSNTYYKVVESRTFQPPVKIHKPMQYVSVCIKQ
jgi:hypothetical protein